MLKSAALLLLLLSLTSAASPPALESLPLTEADFAAAKTLDLQEMARTRSFEGGPISPPKGQHREDAVPKGVWAIWPSGVIPYTMSGDFSDTDRAAIAASFDYLQSHSCIRFTPWTGDFQLPRMDIIADNLGGYCYTSWSTDGFGATYAEVHLSPNSGCTMPRTILHEIYHGLSFYHTHKRFDRDAHVSILYENISPDRYEEFDYCVGCCCETWDMPYDCGSVMHYAKDQMSSNGRDTIVSKSGNCVLLPFQQWNTFQPYMSATDFQLLDNQYGAFC